MKTIPLDELLRQTSPLPFKPWPANADNFGAILDAEGNDVWLSEIEDYASDRAKHEACNMALLAHAANVLPEVVEAVRALQSAYGQLHDTLSDTIEGGRLTEAKLPDDYAAIVHLLTNRCNQAMHTAESALAKATTVPIP